ncbi:MAG TPA: hypothetical protein VMJ32_03425 [Pirellulales bacterium]|nr:hypothetical protein [Pirellulales bacterium]
MSKRIQLGCLALGCLFAGWLLGQIMTGQAWGQATASTSSGSGKYDLRSTFIGDTWETWKIDRSTGESWHEADNKLVKIKDSAQVPAGDYDLALITNGKVYLTYRIDRKSGRTWKINGAEWMELQPDTT